MEDHVGQRRVELDQALGHAGLGIGADLPVGDMAEAAAALGDDAPAGAGEPRIEADDDHGIRP